MEAIDEFRGENIARSLAYTVLEYRQQHKFSALAEIGSNLLCQRLRFLGPNNSKEDPNEWNYVVQWQQDDCPQVIEKLWSGSEQDKLYQNPVYYKRLDAETLHCVVEFAYQHKTHYAVVMALEDGNEDISDLKYQNTKSYSELEWQVIKRTWPDFLEQAEREFVSKIAHPPQVALASPSPEVSSVQHCIELVLTLYVIYSHNHTHRRHQITIGATGHRTKSKMVRCKSSHE